MSLYLDQIFDSKIGVIQLDVPNPAGTGDYTTINGFLTESPSLSFQNNWGSIFPDFNVLGEMSQLMGYKGIFSWLASTQAGWKGTEPLNIGVEFYVISYKRGTNIKKDVSTLVKMAALYSGEGLLENETVKVHGGYANNYWQGNNSFIQNIDGGDNTGNTSLQAEKSGLIVMRVGDQLTLRNLLLSDVSISPSTVQVEEKIPLYIKVNANFRTYRTLLTQDIDNIF